LCNAKSIHDKIATFSTNASGIYLPKFSPVYLYDYEVSVLTLTPGAGDTILLLVCLLWGCVV
jgi:hypothetical protein